MVDVVIFDMDGVIVDSELVHHEVEANILKRFNIEFKFEEHATFVGQTTLDLWTALHRKYSLPESAESLALEDNKNYMNALKSGKGQQIAGVRDLIEKIHNAGVRMVLASSAIHENINIVLKKFDLEAYFLGKVSGQDVAQTKPNPEIFLKAAAMVDAEPAKCLVIEDAKHGVHAAKAAGMSCIGFKNPNSGNQDLSDADLVVDDMSGIDLTVIEQLIDTNTNQ